MSARRWPKHARNLLIALGVGLFAAGMTTWVAPAFAPAPTPARPPTMLQWTDGQHGGQYGETRTRFITTIDFRRIIFVGFAADQDFYMRNPPPSWAAVISLDQREGFEQVVTYATGWPMPAARLEHWIRWTPPHSNVQLFALPGAEPAPPMEEFRGGRLAARPNGATRPIPHDIIWPGLLANIAIGAVPIWLLLTVWTSGRAWRRRRRGRCESCGYDIRGVDGACPECGVPNRTDVSRQ